MLSDGRFVGHASSSSSAPVSVLPMRTAPSGGPATAESAAEEPGTSSGPATAGTGSQQASELHGNVHPTAETHHTQEMRTLRALVIEDMREACVELRSRGYQCDRITHNELMASTGEEYLGNLLRGDYDMLWIATPCDWCVQTPDKRANPHWQRVQHWMKKAITFGM